MRSIAEANADQAEARGNEENVRLTVSVLMNVLEKLRTMDNARFTKVVETLFAKDDNGSNSAKMTSPEERESTGKTERAENYIPRHGKPCEEEDEYGRISAEEAVGRILRVLWGYERQFFL